MARSLPRVPVATTADPRTRPLIRFDARMRLLEAAQSRMRRNYSVGSGMLTLHLDIEGLPAPDLNAARTDVNRLVRNAAKSMLDAVQQLNRRIGYDTGLMASAWKERVTPEGDGKFTIELKNPTPYSAVAKRAGSDWHAGRTMLDHHIRPLVRRLTGQLARQLRETIASMLRRRRR